MTATLPNDISRCDGVHIDGEWREGCEDCQRRTAPPPDGPTWWITPPAIIVFECESRIPPEADR